MATCFLLWELIAIPSPTHNQRVLSVNIELIRLITLLLYLEALFVCIAVKENIHVTLKITQMFSFLSELNIKIIFHIKQLTVHAMNELKTLYYSPNKYYI